MMKMLGISLRNRYKKKQKNINYQSQLKMNLMCTSSPQNNSAYRVIPTFNLINSNPTKFNCDSIPDMTGKICLITGGNKGTNLRQC